MIKHHECTEAFTATIHEDCVCLPTLAVSIAASRCVAGASSAAGSSSCSVWKRDRSVGGPKNVLQNAGDGQSAHILVVDLLNYVVNREVPAASSGGHLMMTRGRSLIERQIRAADG